MVRCMKKLLKTIKADFTRNPFKTKEGVIVIGQTPNASFVVFIVAKILQIVSKGSIDHLFSMIAFGVLFTWAWLELFDGVNAFRRLLGLAVMIAALRGVVG